jgi:DNA-binding NtrC family response regulator
MKLRSQMENLIDEMLDGQIMLNEAISEFEKLYIQKALLRNAEHLSNTADILGIHRNTLSKRVSTYQEKPKTPKRLISHRSR